MKTKSPGLGGRVGLQIDDLARVVSRLHGAAAHVDGLCPFDVFQLWRRKYFAARGLIDEDTLLVAGYWGSDDRQTWPSTKRSAAERPLLVLGCWQG